MNLQDSFSRLNPLLSQAKQVAILIGGNTFDHLVAGISLGLSLEAAGKKVSLFASQVPGEEAKGVRGVEKMRTDFGQKDLMVVLDYPLDNIEKVSSQEEGNQLKLVVKVKSGLTPIKAEQVKVVSQAVDYQVGLVIDDENTFSNFGQFSSHGKWIYLGKDGAEKNWAQVSLVETNTSFSEMMARIVQGLGLPLDQKIAGNLYEGIKKATGSFAALTSYKTLETAALCLKLVQGNQRPAPLSNLSQIPIEQVEKKEGVLPSPRIFKGATTPRV